MDVIEQTKGKSYSGQCHCGAVQISMTGPLYPFVICHCSDCLRLAGYTWAAAKLRHEQLVITKGADNVDWYASSDFAKRGFCKSCHAQMFFRDNDSAYTSVSVGMFDDCQDMQTAGHIFRSSIPDCCHKIDNLPDIDTAFYDAAEAMKE